MSGIKKKRDKVEDLEKIVDLPSSAVSAALKEIGHMKSCWICDSSKWILESLKGKATPIRFEGLARGYTAAFQLTCSSCGHLRFADAQTVYTHLLRLAEEA
ncbi:hypothetical protein HK44_020460 [Pseudomonas fluorescens HK44]|uniref:Uncharacterized protein n=1 Tax=Pseudomonas fluorescens HK44 TaxID=1042209 RepID=A0A010TGS9_PSEFL|nr:hypothetical protein [Pseudomonas fluorescens]EXF96277.1 hypothetical protein HK44_020460 [Pseudomonas fluorescens HK44]